MFVAFEYVIFLCLRNMKNTNSIASLLASIMVIAFFFFNLSCPLAYIQYIFSKHLKLLYFE